MDNYKVYKYTNLINFKVYIGRTKMSLAERAGKNGSKYHALKYFGAAIIKYGWDNFVGEILEENLSYEECCEKEKYYIELYDSRNPNKGYNIAIGGEGPTKESLEKMKKSHLNKHLSEEHKRHISEGLGGKGITNVNYGRKQTEIARKHNSESKKGEKSANWGKHLSDSTKEKICKKVSKACIQYDLEGNYIAEWENSKIAAKKLNLNYKGINNCLRYLRHSSGGFLWEYKDKKLREKYSDNKYILENYGINGFKRKEELLKNKNNINQEKASTTISWDGE